MSRRSVYQMRGARVAVSFLAAVPGLTVALLWAFPPQGTRYVPLRFTYGWPFYATLVVSLVALAFAFRFGGRPRGVGAPVSAHDEAGVRSSPPEKGRVLH